MSPYYEPHHYSKEEVKELLILAASDKFNIFYDRNKIVVNLCRTLLKEMENNENR
tara:strand:+ start:3556 stop:3720 length:165 start_codon:yes stop_codon:yes gene_type:complete